MNRWRLALLVTSLAWLPEARAESGRSIALLQVEVAGDGNQLAQPVETALASAVSRAGARLVTRDRVDAAVARQPELSGCLSATCLGTLSTAVDAQQFLRAHIAASGNSYELDLELLSAAAEGGLAGRVQRNCSVCTVAEMSEMVASAADDLLAGRGDADRVEVEILCRPDGAEIIIDDKVRGVGPLKVQLAPGRHRVVARLDGHTKAFKEIEVTATSGGQRFELVLTSSSALGPSSGPFRTWKWALAGTAAAALVTGVGLLMVDGNGTCGSSGDECPMVYDTRAAGLLGLVVGVAAGGASAWMFARDSSYERAR
jgi:hypothetical protein